MDENKCEWMFRSHEPSIQCTVPGIWGLSARHGKEIVSCTVHLGVFINELYNHDPDAITVYRIGVRASGTTAI